MADMQNTNDSSDVERRGEILSGARAADAGV
jgi:hypothetical protein